MLAKIMNMVEVYQAAGEVEANVIKGLLESHGIHCWLKSNAAPSVHMFTFDGMGMVTVVVAKSQVEQAKRLIREK